MALLLGVSAGLPGCIDFKWGGGKGCLAFGDRCDTDAEAADSDVDSDLPSGMLDDETCLSSASERCFRKEGSWPTGYTYNDHNSTYACETSPIGNKFYFVKEFFVAPYVPYGDVEPYVAFGEATSAWVTIDADSPALAIPSLFVEKMDLAGGDGDQQITMSVGHGDLVRQAAQTTCYPTSTGTGDTSTCGHVECDTIVYSEWNTGATIAPINWTTSNTVGLTEVSLQFLLAHEFGHAIGLGHLSGYPDSLLQPLVEGLPLGGASAEDLEAARYIYGVAGP